MVDHHKLTALRHSYSCNLAWKWIRKFRTDVEGIIRAEALKRYPLPKGAKMYKRQAMPESLENLK